MSALRPKQCAALEAHRPRLLGIVHHNPRCRAPLAPCTCARVSTEEIEPSEARSRRAERIARLRGFAS